MTRQQAIKGIGWKLREVLEIWEDLKKLEKYVSEIKDCVGVHNIYGYKKDSK